MDHQRRKELKQQYSQRRQMGGVFLIKNTVTGQGLLQAEADWQGSKNRHDFSQKTGSCVYGKLAEEWNKYGPNAFAFTLLEELEQKDEQTPREFREDLAVLRELWAEKLGPEQLY